MNVNILSVIRPTMVRTLAFWSFFSLVSGGVIAAEKIVWNFDSDTEVAQSVHFEGEKVGNGMFEGTTLIDPYVFLRMPKGGIKARDYPVLRMRLYSSAEDQDLRIYYASPFGEWCLGYSLPIQQGWHVYEVKLAEVRWSPTEASGPDAQQWGGTSGVVSDLRLDPGDKEGREVKIDWVELGNQITAPPIEAAPRKALPAEIVGKKNEIIPLPKSDGPQSHSPYWTGVMLSHPSENMNRPVSTGNVICYFRRRLAVPENLESAWLQMTVDDFFRLYLNGKKITENMNVDSWKTPTVLDVTTQLKPGENVIAIESINAGGPGGMLFDLTLNRKDGSSEKIVSDDQFVCSAKLESNWMQNDFNDSKWVKPRSMSPPPTAPWVYKLPYVDKSTQVPTECLACDYRKEIHAGEAQTLTVRLKSAKPIQSGEVFFITLEDDGQDLSIAELPLINNSYRQLADGVFEITASTAPLPRYYPARTIRLNFGIYGRKMIMPTTLKEMTFQCQNMPDPGKLKSAVRMVDGVPQLFVNGKVMYPVIGNCWLVDTGLDRAKANIRTFWTDVQMQPKWWIGPNQYSFTGVDKCASAILEQDPQALILPIFFVTAPSWWAKYHPDDIAMFNNGTYWSYGGVSTATFSSEAWKREAAVAVREFVRHLETSPYASRVVGYWFAGGLSAEWQGWACQHCRDTLMDYSPVARQAFCDYLHRSGREQPEGSAQVEIPGFDERLRADGGVFRDPQRSALAIAYDQYLSESIADAVTFFAKVIKEAVQRKKIVGTYSGYSLEYGTYGWALHLSGHNAFRKILDSADLDFIASPPSYAVRAIGDCGEGMHAFASIRRAGKLALVDDDTRTHLSGPGAGCNQTINMAQTQAVLRRNWGRELCRQKGLCLLPIDGGRNLYDPRIERDIRVMGRAGQYLVERKCPRQAEVAVVLDEDSIKYLAYDRENTLMAELVSLQRTRLDQIGAPVDYLLMSDLKRSLPDYKLWIFLSCFQYDEEILKAVEKLKTRGVTALWMYAPGWMANQTGSIANMTRLTGISFGMLTAKTSPRTDVSNSDSGFAKGLPEAMSFGLDSKMAPLFYVDDPKARTIGVYHATGQPSFAVKKVGQSQFLFCGANQIPAALLMNIAREAGVHLYCESLDFIDANENFLMLHARTGGEKTLHLKQKCDVVDLCDGKVLKKNVDTLTFDIPTERTKVFFLGDSTDFMKFMNYPQLEMEPEK